MAPYNSSYIEIKNCSNLSMNKYLDNNNDNNNNDNDNNNNNNNN